MAIGHHELQSVIGTRGIYRDGVRKPLLLVERCPRIRLYAVHDGAGDGPPAPVGHDGECPTRRRPMKLSADGQLREAGSMTVNLLMRHRLIDCSSSLLQPDQHFIHRVGDQPIGFAKGSTRRPEQGLE